jgi:hypothetical protein
VHRTRRHSLADRAIRILAVTTVSGLAVLAGWISYHHMLLLARRSGHTGIDAHAFPLTVDGLDLIGVLVLLADRRTGRRSGPLPWAVLGVGATASLAANIAVAPDNLVARAISGWSAIALLAAAKMLAHLFEPAQPDTTGALASSADVAATAAASGPQPEPARTAAGRDHADAAGGPPRRNGHARDSARRLPTGPAALNRWRRIWLATAHHDTATAEVARQHGVSLRTLQFIRAAGEQGHLDLPAASPDPTDTTTDAGVGVAVEPASLNHHGTAADAT